MATQAEIAAHLDLTQGTVSQMITAGILPAAERGALNADWCRIAYIRHLRSIAAGRGTLSDEEGGKLTAERIRYASEQADALAMKNDLARGAVVPVAVSVSMVVAAYTAVRTKLLALPSKCAPKVFNLKKLPEIQAVLTAEVTEALEELSRDGAGAAA